MGAESEERPKQVVCYRARMRLGGGGGGWRSWIWRMEGEVEIYSQSTCLAGCSGMLGPKECHWSWRLG